MNAHGHQELAAVGRPGRAGLSGALWACRRVNPGPASHCVVRVRVRSHPGWKLFPAKWAYEVPSPGVTRME